LDVIEAFNALPTVQLERELAACCAAPQWSARVLGGRPYPSREDLAATADAAARALSWAQVAKGLAAHPRIGERAAGESRAAAWSRREQSAAAQGADDATNAALVRANRDYEDRFGHVFLIFASGRSQGEILAAAEARLANDEATERAIVTDELRKIALLRLGRLLDGLEG
jgi:2-oxo-4-hydroxy-4-carboxy-5-ureidoimidazoline decarboxylase